MLAGIDNNAKVDELMGVLLSRVNIDVGDIGI